MIARPSVVEESVWPMVAYEFDQHLPEFNLVGDDLSLLANVGTLIVPEIDAVLSEFYAHALNDADLAKYFKTEASVDHARIAPKAHWINLFSGRFDVDYFASVRRVGAIHAKIDLPLFAYVSTYFKATGRLLEALTHKAQVPPKRFRVARSAIFRLSATPMPRVSATKSGAKPMGSIMTKSATKTGMRVANSMPYP